MKKTQHLIHIDLEFDYKDEHISLTYPYLAEESSVDVLHYYYEQQSGHTYSTMEWLNVPGAVNILSKIETNWSDYVLIIYDLYSKDKNFIDWLKVHHKNRAEQDCIKHIEDSELDFDDIDLDNIPTPQYLNDDEEL